MKKLILVTVDTDKENDYLADALSVELVFKLRPFVPGETAELVKLRGEEVTVLDFKDLIPEELLP
jgi:hypothetical protein